MKRLERTWMYERLDANKRINVGFLNGVREFVNYVKEQESFTRNHGKMRCPCVKCCNAKYLNEYDVKQHLTKNGFCLNYYDWVCHGEAFPLDDQVQVVSNNPYQDMVNDALLDRINDLREDALNAEDKFTTKKAEALQTQPENEIDEDEIYFKAVGGHNRKGVVFGTGQASPMFYNRPRHSSAGEKSYEPGLVSKLTKENRALATRMDAFEAWKAQMEASQGTIIPTPSCNPGLDSIHEDNFDGDGGGHDGGDPILA